MSRNRRIFVDVNKLISSSFKVHIENDNFSALTVEFPGPHETAYAGGIWLVRVELPNNYPYSSPSVVFRTPIFHPNIDSQTGSVCLDVINQTWTPMFGLVNIFESFLPQLLAYPNASDPLNREAAILYNQSTQRYNTEIMKETLKHAKPLSNTPTTELNKPNGVASQAETDSDMSSLDELSDEN